jgi:hypothetical protein
MPVFAGMTFFWTYKFMADENFVYDRTIFNAQKSSVPPAAAPLQGINV